MISKIISAFLYLAAVIIWLMILAILYLLTFGFFNNVIENFGNGILRIIFIAIHFSALILPFLFRKKIKSDMVMPVILIISTISSVFVIGGINFAVNEYVSVYTKEKWNRNEDLRFNMIDDIESKYNFIGMSEAEIIDLFGEPESISEHDGKRYEYYIGNAYIDAFYYNFIFENGIVVKNYMSQS